MANTKYQVVKPILHDKKLLKKNAPLVLEDDEAKPLLASGHIVAPEAKGKQPE